MLDYVKKNWDTFDKQPFFEMDALVFAWFSYIDFPDVDGIRDGRGVALHEIFRAEEFENMFYGMHSIPETKEMLVAALASPRYRNIRILNYKGLFDHERTVQFAAMTFQLSEGEYYVAYRGTDKSLVGWREDFHLSLDVPIQGQILALSYLRDVAAALPKDAVIYVGGHSKGGNLAVYASARVDRDIQERIKAVYSFDGPGFSNQELTYEGYGEIRDRIIKIIPQSSMIGMIFNPECEYRIVKSKAKSILQHNPFSWIIEDEAFIEQDGLTADAKLLFESLNEWLEGYDLEDRKLFINVVFDVLDATGASNFTEFGADLQKYIPIIAKEIRYMDKPVRKKVLTMMRELASVSFNNIPEIVSDRMKNAAKEILKESN